MSKLADKSIRMRRKKRVRAKIFGTAEKPRLCVFISLKNIYAQLIDDNKGVTLASAESKKIAGKLKNNIEGAAAVGKLIAKKALEMKIAQAVFDRAGRQYHGKIKALADGAREGGLKF